MGLIDYINNTTGNDPNDGTNMLMRLGGALNPQLGMQMANAQNQKLAQTLQMAQLAQMQKEAEASALTKQIFQKYPNASPQELTALLASVNPDKFGSSYLKQMGNQVSTSPTGGSLANMGVPNNSMQAAPAAPAPQMQPLYKGGVPLTEGAEAGFMWAQDPSGQRKQIRIPGGTLEKAQAEGVESLKTTLGLVDQMIGNEELGMPEHPGLEGAVGGVSSRLPSLSGDVLDFEAMLEQAKGGAFLSAIQQLKGMGSLSDAEGKAATTAATRMRTAISEDGFRKAAKEYRDVMGRAVARAEGKQAPTGNPKPEAKGNNKVVNWDDLP